MDYFTRPRLAGNLTADDLDTNVRIVFRVGTVNQHYREGKISMITHTRKTTNVRINNHDWRLRSTDIVYQEDI